MKRRATPVFLERRTYRVRRLFDAIRLLPILGAFLWIMPILLRNNADTEPSISRLMIYMFVVWIGLILVNFVLVYLIKRSERSWDQLMTNDDLGD